MSLRDIGIVELKVGARLRSVVCDTEVIVIRAAGKSLDIRCGGHPMVPLEQEAGCVEPMAGYAEGTVLGKRYVSVDATLELLATKAGVGSLSLGEALLAIVEPKRLPASD